MKRPIWISLTAALLLLAVWTMLPAHTRNTVTDVILQNVAWTYTELQTFAGGATIVEGDWSQSLVIPDPSTAPNVVNLGGSSGNCQTAQEPITFYVSWRNTSGETLLSPASSAVTGTSGDDDSVLVISPAIDAKAETWVAWWKDGVTADYRGCQADGSILEISNEVSGNATTCFCGDSTDPTEPASNTTTGSRAAINGTGLGIERPGTQVFEVCKLGCTHATITHALDSISDATSTKRYTVLVYPGDYDEIVTAESYVSLVGVDRLATRIRGVGTVGNGIKIPANTLGLHISNLTVGGAYPIAPQTGNTARAEVVITNVDIGIIDGTENVVTSQDCIITNGSDWDLRLYNVNCRTDYDGIVYGENNTIRWIGGLVEMPLRDTPITAFVRGQSNAKLDLVIDSVTIDVSCAHSGVAWDLIKYNGSGGDDESEPIRIALRDVDLRASFTHASWALTLDGIDLVDAMATSSPGTVILDNVTMQLDVTSSSGTIVALKIGSDADFAAWSVGWNGGSISRSGAATSWDLFNGHPTLAATLVGVQMAGATNGPIGISDQVVGKFSSRLIVPGAVNLNPGSCSLGEFKMDIGGATQELCICNNGGTAYDCWDVTTLGGPKD